MNNFFRIFLGLSIWFFLIVIALCFTGKLTFGNGLGDLAYLMGIGCVMLMIAGAYFVTRGADLEANKPVAIMIMSVVLLFIIYFTYHFTIGRGSEYRWNGHVFFYHKPPNPSGDTTTQFYRDDTTNRKP